eukprot:scaffold113375_cov60-Phaeocystis_antarctica.AAC.1
MRQPLYHLGWWCWSLRGRQSGRGCGQCGVCVQARHRPSCQRGIFPRTDAQKATSALSGSSASGADYRAEGMGPAHRPCALVRKEQIPGANVGA